MRPRAEQPIPTLILRSLELGPSSAYCLSEELGLNVRNIRPYLKLLHTAETIRISGYEQRTGPPLPIWSLKDGKDDVRKPRRKYKR